MNERELPIGIGAVDKEYMKQLIISALDGTPFPPQTPNINYVRDEKKEVLRESVKTFKITPINWDITDEVAKLCISEDFFYGAKPELYAKRALTLRKEWFTYLLGKYEFAGLLAYNENKPCGFIEVIRGDIADRLGMSPLHPLNETWVILCLSVVESHWKQNIGSRLIHQLKSDLKDKGTWLEVMAYKKGFWHPYNLYERQGFKILKDLDKSCIMGFPLS